MHQIDPRKTWRLVEEHLARESDPRRRRNLETVLKHMKAEASADFEALMSTVAPNAHYTFFGPEDTGPKSYDEVSAFYRGIVESDTHRIEHDVVRLTVGDDKIVTEGVIKIAYPGRLLEQMGKPVDDPDAYYLYISRMCIIWVMDDDGLVVSEDSYNDRDGFVGIETRKISLADVYQVEAA